MALLTRFPQNYFPKGGAGVDAHVPVPGRTLSRSPCDGAFFSGKPERGATLPAESDGGS